MKIVSLTEEDVKKNDSKADIKDAVKDAVKDSSGKDISDKAADKVADDAKKLATEVNADTVEIAFDDSDFETMEVKNSFTKALDRCYDQAKWAQAKRKRGLRAVGSQNLLVLGLPGGGKTSIVKAWAKQKGLICVCINASSNKVDVEINGIPMKDTSPDAEPNTIVYAHDNKLLGALGKGPSILFCDEYNRQMDPSLRRPFLDLFADKRNVDGSMDFRDTLLFSIVCANPYGADFHDEGVAELFPAERGRFVKQLNWDSTNEAAKLYFDGTFYSNMASLGYIIPGSAAAKKYKVVGPVTKEARNPSEETTAMVESEIKVHDLATKLLTDPNFNFDTRDAAIQNEIADKHLQGFYQRDLTSLLENSRGDVEDFLFEIENPDEDHAAFRPEVNEMLHNILDGYEPNMNNLRTMYCIDKAYKADENGEPIIEDEKDADLPDELEGEPKKPESEEPEEDESGYFEQDENDPDAAKVAPSEQDAEAEISTLIGGMHF